MLTLKQKYIDKLRDLGLSAAKSKQYVDSVEDGAPLPKPSKGYLEENILEILTDFHHDFQTYKFLESQKEIAYVDLDNVLADYSGAMKYKTEYQKQTIKRQPGFFLNLRPIPGAIDAFKRLCDKYCVYVLSTAPWSNPSSWTEKQQWVDLYLQDYGYKRLILCHNKSLLIGKYLIDDSTINGAKEFKGELIQIGNSKKFANWDAVLKYLKA
jgi:5'(3')-deoxyribonucleotidase